MKTSYADVPSFVTKDGSIIRELLHPAAHGNRNQSLAEAIVPAGEATLRHRHHRSEEIYHVTAGTGIMQMGKDEIAIAAGDTICIAPGTPHSVRNTGSGELRILCASSPAYSHDDTELL